MKNKLNLRERLRNVVGYWNEDESLLLNEGIEAIIRVFIDYVESIIPKARLGHKEASDYIKGCVDGWNECRETLLEKIKK